MSQQTMEAKGAKKPDAPDGPDTAELFEQIGRLKMELEWVKKKADQLA